MTYHFPEDRRLSERRRAGVARPDGPDRRVSERRVVTTRNGEVKLVRKPQPMHRGVLWAAVLMILVLSDSVFLDGAYRHMVINGINGVAASMQHWSEHLWDGGR